MNIKMLKAASAGLVLSVSGLANAGLISGVIVDSSTPPATFGTDFINTINGAGLSGGVPSLTSIHSGTVPSNSAVQSGTTLSVTYDLGDIYDIFGFSFWNQNNGGPGANGSTGIKDFTLMSSFDGVNFSSILTSTFFQKSTASELPEQFSLTSATGRYIRLNGLNNYGDIANTGFAEIQFDGQNSASVPEPSTLAIFALGIMGLASRRFKKQ